MVVERRVLRPSELLMMMMQEGLFFFYDRWEVGTFYIL
jgi:hypothetical protein